MKRFFALMLLAAPMPALADIDVFACEPEWAALARELGGDRVSVDSATTPFQDIHYIQARPSLLSDFRRADMIVCTGAELEIGWMPVLLRRGGNADVQPGKPGHFLAYEFVEMKGVPDTVDRSKGDVHAYGNPHIQLSPHNIAKVADGLAGRLAEVDPEGAAYYRQRHADFSGRWQAAIEDWERRAARLSGMQVVTHHKSWIYLIEWLGLEKVGTLEPKPGIPPSSSHLAQLLKRLEDKDVRLIIRSAYQPERASEWLSERIGAPYTVIPQTVGATEDANDLFDLFDAILTRLEEASK